MSKCRRRRLALGLVSLALFVTTVGPTRASSLNDRNENMASPTLSPVPPVDQWPYRPLFLQAGTDTRVIGHRQNDPLPIGRPFAFESSLFKGKALIRIRDIKSGDPISHDRYFNGTKKLKQVVIQGHFKHPLPMSEVFYGDVYEKRFHPAPPAQVIHLFKQVFRRLAPGVTLDLSSHRPRVLALYAGCADSLSIHLPGHEPNLMDRALPEDMHFQFPEMRGLSIRKRRKLLSSPKHASAYTYDPKYVYTFHCYDNFLGRYEMNLPLLGKLDMVQTLNGQPMSISAVTQDGRFLFRFCIWHERMRIPPPRRGVHSHARQGLCPIA